MSLSRGKNAVYYSNGISLKGQPYDGLEVVFPADQAEEGDKYVAGGEEKQSIPSLSESGSYKIALGQDQKYSAEPLVSVESKFADKQHTRDTPRSLWKRQRWWIVGAFMLLVVIVIAVTVAVVLSRRNTGEVADESTGSQSASANDTNSAVAAASNNVALPMTTGSYESIINGTRLTQLVPHIDDSRNRFLIYQAGNGSLRTITESRIVPNGAPTYTWQSPSEEPLPAEDVMPATPLTAVSTFDRDDLLHWYLFYVNNDHIIQALHWDNDTRVWSQWNIDYRMEVSPHPNIAFAVGWGQSYEESAGGDIRNGLSLYATNPSGLVQEYIYTEQTSSWSQGFAFGADANGLGGAYFGYMPDQGYLVLHGGGRRLNLYYRHYDGARDRAWGLKATIGSAYPSVENGAACTGGRTVAFQDPSGRIMVSNFSADALPADWSWSRSYVAAGLEERAMNRTGLGCWFYQWGGDADRGIYFSIQYQTVDGSIRQASIPWYDDFAQYDKWIHETVYEQTSG